MRPHNLSSKPILLLKKLKITTIVVEILEWVEKLNVRKVWAAVLYRSALILKYVFVLYSRLDQIKTYIGSFLPYQFLFLGTKKRVWRL